MAGDERRISGLRTISPVFREPFRQHRHDLGGSQTHTPGAAFWLLDGIGRAVFSAWMLYNLLVWHVPAVVMLFVVPEVLFGIAQLGGSWLLMQKSRA